MKVDKFENEGSIGDEKSETTSSKHNQSNDNEPVKVVFFKQEEINEIKNCQRDENFSELMRLKRDSVSADTRF